MLRGFEGILRIALRRAESLRIALRCCGVSLRAALRFGASLRIVSWRCGVTPHAALQCFGATLRIALRGESLRTTLQFYEASPANLCLHTRHGKSLRALRCHGANVLNLWQAMLSYLAATLRLPMAEFATEVMQRLTLVGATLDMLSSRRVPWRTTGLAAKF